MSYEKPAVRDSELAAEGIATWPAVDPIVISWIEAAAGRALRHWLLLANALVTVTLVGVFVAPQFTWR